MGIHYRYCWTKRRLCVLLSHAARLLVLGLNRISDKEANKICQRTIEGTIMGVLGMIHSRYEDQTMASELKEQDGAAE